MSHELRCGRPCTKCRSNRTTDLRSVDQLLDATLNHNQIVKEQKDRQPLQERMSISLPGWTEARFCVTEALPEKKLCDQNVPSVHQTSKSRPMWEGSNIQSDKCRVKRVLAKDSETLFASPAEQHIYQCRRANNPLNLVLGPFISPVETATLSHLYPRRESYTHRQPLAMTRRKKLCAQLLN
jgi:hypothetical protein